MSAECSIPSHLPYRPQVLFAGRVRSNPTVTHPAICKIGLVEDGNVLLGDGTRVTEGGIFILGDGLASVRIASPGVRVALIGFICEPIRTTIVRDGRRGRYPIEEPKVWPITRWWDPPLVRFALQRPPSPVIDLVQLILSRWWLNDDHQSLADAHLAELLAHLVPILRQGYDSLLNGEELQLSESQSLRAQVVKVVEKHAGNPGFTTAGLARLMGLSRSHLARKMAAAGLTGPGEFIRNRRIAMAKAMLLDRTCSLQDVANRCGYASAGSLRHCFKASEGETIQQWQKKTARASAPKA